MNSFEVHGLVDVRRQAQGSHPETVPISNVSPTAMVLSRGDGATAQATCRALAVGCAQAGCLLRR